MCQNNSQIRNSKKVPYAWLRLQQQADWPAAGRGGRGGGSTYAPRGGCVSSRGLVFFQLFGTNVAGCVSGDSAAGRAQAAAAHSRLPLRAFIDRQMRFYPRFFGGGWHRPVALATARSLHSLLD